LGPSGSQQCLKGALLPPVERRRSLEERREVSADLGTDVLRICHSKLRSLALVVEPVACGSDDKVGDAKDPLCPLVGELVVDEEKGLHEGQIGEDLIRRDRVDALKDMLS